MRIELQQLRTFAAVAAEGNLTRAARRLFLSQPAISTQLKALEDELGVVLFERTARGMRLTPRGHELLPHAEAVLASFGALVDQAARVRGEVRGRFHLGAASDAETLRLGPLLCDLGGRFPAVEVEVTRGHSRALMEMIEEGRLDGAFVFGDVRDEPLSGFRVETIDVYLAAPAKLADAFSQRPVDSFVAHPWIVTPPSSRCRRLAEDLFRRSGARPPQLVQADGEATVRTLIAAGVGVGLLHATTALAAEREGGVVLFRDISQRLDLWFAHATSREDDPILAAVCGVIRAAWRAGDAATIDPASATTDSRGGGSRSR